MNRTARKLFSSDDDAIEFLEDYGLNEARARMLKESGRVLESAEVHAEEGDMVKAVETLAASAVHNSHHVRPTIKYLLAGLWQGLTLGVLPTSASIASELLGFADKLDRRAMTKQEVNEASCSHPFSWRA